MTRFVIDPQALIDFLREDQPLTAGHQLVAPNAVRSQALQLLLVTVRDGETPNARLWLCTRG